MKNLLISFAAQTEISVMVITKTEFLKGTFELMNLVIKVKIKKIL